MKNPADIAIMFVSGLALLATMTVAQAQTLSDPTRPPASIEKSVDGSEAKAETGLQSIIRRAGAKPAAIINGEYVVLGGSVGDAKLVRIGEDFVTLKSATGRETLRLIPGVEKTQASSTETGEKTAAGKAARIEVKK